MALCDIRNTGESGDLAFWAGFKCPLLEAFCWGSCQFLSPSIQSAMYVMSAISVGKNTARLCLADRFRIGHYENLIASYIVQLNLAHGRTADGA